MEQISLIYILIFRDFKDISEEAGSEEKMLSRKWSFLVQNRNYQMGKLQGLRRSLWTSSKKLLRGSQTSRTSLWTASWEQEQQQLLLLLWEEDFMVVILTERSLI